MALTWNEQLQKLLIKIHGNNKGQSLYKKYSHAFPAGYVADYTVNQAAADIACIEQLSDKKLLATDFYLAPHHGEHPLHLRLFQWGKPIPLSDVLPMLENLDLRTYNESPHKITLNKDLTVWISDFSVVYDRPNLDLAKVKPLVQDVFAAVYAGISENDGFNKLILSASLSWQEIRVFRAYAKYLRQVRFRFSQSYIENALVNHPDIANSLIALFMARNNPASQKKGKNQAEKIEQQIMTALESVVSLDEDRILRRILDLIKATVRTNYFQTNADKQSKAYLSFKLNSRSIPELPLPKPLFEIYVYSPRFEGIHLRNAKVARGGIRWSDRREDFRTEILGLMKAQVVKNAVIVPSGAKGGFVLKMLPAHATREITQAEVVTCYRMFISGLLDLTDNIKNNKIVPPANVVRHDEDDPYLVVAADKGTATFSDIANSLSQQYHFWLGDAFASGGSAGYDHKKMGITARGAWESIKRHFSELNVDVTKTDITVAGIGDMSGDVFGNGMLYTPHIKLIGAFDHRHIFIDPDPDPVASFAERKRLFNLPTSSWEDYNPKLISKGGGVFKRSLKSITLTPQMKKALGTDETSLTPNELIRVILRAPVDLLFNGGIGTYVKATRESHADVGDRTNEYCRVDGCELRCKVVGEGGNLGFTQLGRIEFALNGGLINTDFIDNSAGVDCSDHEVNLKILLGEETSRGHLTEKNRNKLLASLTDDVAELVLSDNYHQALVMSFSAATANKYAALHLNFLKELESLDIINRKVEFLPDDKQVAERMAEGKGFTRPEIAVLLAYSKIHIKQELLKSNMLDDPYLSQIIVTAFPEPIHKKYLKALNNHPLRHDIIATQLSNRIVNEMGITFVYRLQTETGATAPEIVRAHAVASQVYGINELQKRIESLSLKIPYANQYEMLFHMRNLINLATRWFLYSNHLNDDLEKLITHFAERVKKLENLIPEIMAGSTKEYMTTLTKEFARIGLPESFAKRIGTHRAMYTALNIIEVATTHKFDLHKTARVYFEAGERIHLLWFRDQIARDSRDGQWNALARLTLRDQLDAAQRALTVAVMRMNQKEANTSKLITKWMDKNEHALQRWNKLLAMLQNSASIEYTMFFIAMRELNAIIETCQ